MQSHQNQCQILAVFLISAATMWGCRAPTSTVSDGGPSTDGDTDTDSDTDTDGDTDGDSDTDTDTDSCTSAVWEGDKGVKDSADIDILSGYARIGGRLFIEDSVLTDLTKIL